MLTEVIGQPISEVFATTNLLESPGDEESIEKIRERSLLMRELLSGRKVIALGRIVSRALTGRAGEWMEWDAFDFDASPSGMRMTALAVLPHLPHPSGLNRWWNDRRNRESVRRFLRDAVLASVGATRLVR